MATFVALTSLTAAALACPAPPPGSNFRCTKYDHMNGMDHVEQPPAAPPLYQLAGRVTPPRYGGGRLTRLLTSGPWTVATPRSTTGFAVPAVEIGVDSRPLRFLRPASASPADLGPETRTVLLRAIEQREDKIYVQVDSEYYLLSACQVAPRRWTSCLTLTSAPGPEAP